MKELKIKSIVLIIIINITLTSCNSTSISQINISTPIPKTSDYPKFSTVRSIIVGFLLVLITILIILGNGLVCVTIIFEKHLQTPTNYFVFSLAMADASLGILVLPFSIISTLSVKPWFLGNVFCNIWISLDVMLCTTSILTLFAISLDRWFAVTRPFIYLRLINHKRVFLFCTGFWIISIMFAFVPIFAGWNTEDGFVQNTREIDISNNVCIFEKNKVFVLIVSILTYFIPLAVMFALTMKVFKVTREQTKKIKKLEKMITNVTKTREAESIELKPLQIKRSKKNILSLSLRNIFKKNKLSQSNEHKATITLGSVVIAFLICWIPYFTVFTMRPFVSFNINYHLEEFFLWLGYANSSLNPFLYGFYNSQFRAGFANVLIHRWRKRN
ncbi:TaR-4 [Intoshia linei]|uniref:TaR-4 n=1 Tax=Intoshia linei TaxID=1819745 RepID=A0A177AXJ1_9BILA|nr:TaR-4 [Intoshia linei]